MSLLNVSNYLLAMLNPHWTPRSYDPVSSPIPKSESRPTPPPGGSPVDEEKKNINHLFLTVTMQFISVNMAFYNKSSIIKVSLLERASKKPNERELARREYMIAIASE